jgi:signal peptidase I
MKSKKSLTSPSLPQLEKELHREQYKYRYASVMRSTINTLIIVAAFAILVATLWMPVLQIYGNAMDPSLTEGQVVVCVKTADMEQGDLMAFYVGNHLLVKRVIAGPGDVVDITPSGTVYINGQELHEPYVSEKSRGECDVEYPYKVPAYSYFVMSDNRSNCVDSRASIVGCVTEEHIMGKVIFRIWPFNSFGKID